LNIDQALICRTFSPPPSRDRVVRLNDDQVWAQPLVTRPDAVYIDPQSSYFSKVELQEEQDEPAQPTKSEPRITLPAFLTSSAFSPSFDEDSEEGLCYLH
jgi:hypothetical protein